MARGLEEARVDGELYQIAQWQVDKSLEILVWLTKTMGESFAGILQTGNSEELLDQDITELLAPAIANLVPKLNERDVQKKCREIVEEVLHEGRQIVYDIHFQGRVGHLFKLMVEVLKIQYRDFFGALSASKPLGGVVGARVSTQAK